MLVPHALSCDWSGCTLATSPVAEWFNRECLPKFVNELAPPTLQTFWHKRTTVAFTSVDAFKMQVIKIPHGWLFMTTMGSIPVHYRGRVVHGIKPGVSNQCSLYQNSEKNIVVSNIMIYQTIVFKVAYKYDTIIDLPFSSKTP